MLAVILNQHLIKRRKQEEYKAAHSSPPDYETKNIVSSSDGVSCAEKNENIYTRLLIHQQFFVHLKSNKNNCKKNLQKYHQPVKNSAYCFLQKK